MVRNNKRINPFVPKFDRSSVSIILWNLTPVLGVLFFNWEPMSVFVCYALETIIVGAFNVLRLIAVYRFGLPQAADETGVSGLAIIPFFLVHYYFFVFIQLSFFLPAMGAPGFGPISAAQYIFKLAFSKSYLFAFGLFMVNNVFIYIFDFIGSGIYRQRTMAQQMFEPYTRIFVQQFVVILGSMVFTLSGSGMFVLILLVIIKTWADLLFFRGGLLEWAKEKQAELKAQEQANKV